MSDDKINFKREKLAEVLGDFKDWENLGWFFDTDEKQWFSTWKNPLHSREYIGALEKDGKLPPFRIHCHCSTKIIKNILIRHITTGRFDFVGSECMKYFGIHLRKCISCHEQNLCRSTRCAKCRRKCRLHDVYHDDNADHQLELDRELARIKAERFKVLTFGKHLGKNVDDLLGVDDGYLQFLARILDGKPSLCAYIRTELLLKTKIQFGKYRQAKTFEWIRGNDPSYWRWLTTESSLPIRAILS